MALRTGLAAQLGFVAESTYGTYVAPTIFPDFVSESLKLDQGRIVSKGIKAGSTLVRSNRRRVNRKGGAGDLNYEVAGEGFGKLFKHMGFATVNTTTAGSTGKAHALTRGDISALSMTIQAGRPDVTGTVRPYSYLGCVFPDWELSCEVDQYLMLKLGVDFRDETTAQSLATASDFVAELLDFQGGTITVDGDPYDVTKFSLKGDNKMKTDRHFLGTALKKHPLVSDLCEITGSIEVEHGGLDLYALYQSGADVAFTASFVGPEFEAGHNFQLDIDIPAIQIDGETPNIEGPDVLMQSVPFTVVDNENDEPITLTYTTTDATV